MINKSVLIGRLTRDIDLQKTQSGVSITRFTLACDRNTKGADGNKVTDFISCVAWRQPAEFLSRYARKGSLVGIEGMIQTRDYERDGRKVYVTEVIANDVQLLDTRKKDEEPDWKQETKETYTADAVVDVDGSVIDTDKLPF